MFVYTNMDIRGSSAFPDFTPRSGRAFFSLQYPEKGEYTVDNFLKALRAKRIEDAMVYVSKNYMDRIDLAELEGALLTESKLCVNYVLKTGYHNRPKNCIDLSFMVMIDGGARLFNVYMLKEPNRFGKWKIYDIDSEEGSFPVVKLRGM